MIGRHKGRIIMICQAYTDSRADLEEIAKVKMGQLNAIDLDGAVKVIAGTARSMGVEVEG